MAAPTTTVRRETEEATAILVLDGAGRRNAIASATLDELDAHLAGIDGDPAVRAIVVCGEGTTFSAGADIGELAGLAPQAMADHLRHFTDVFGRLSRSGKPSVAAIEGVALGGGFELALACDLRLAARGARLGLPEVKLGLLPGAGGSQRLARMLPPATAKELLMTGAMIDAPTSQRLGLVNEVVPDGTTRHAAVELAAQLAALPPLALAAAKQLVDEGGPLPLDAGLALERSTVAMLSATADAIEGIEAFLAKRAPVFHGS